MKFIGVLALIASFLIMPANADACSVDLSKVDFLKPSRSIKQIFKGIEAGDQNSMGTLSQRLYDGWAELNNANPSSAGELANSWREYLDQMAPRIYEQFTSAGVSDGDRLALTNALRDFYNGIVLSGSDAAAVAWQTACVTGSAL